MDLFCSHSSGVLGLCPMSSSDSMTMKGDFKTLVWHRLNDPDLKIPAAMRGGRLSPFNHSGTCRKFA